MNSDIISAPSPEAQELENKLLELNLLQNDLVELELEKATLQSLMSRFELRYTCEVGFLYCQLDDVEAKIMEQRVRANPDDADLRQSATEARATAQESTYEANFAINQPAKESFVPSDELKRLYREVAKCVHPDLAENEAERTLRHQTMVAVNLSYEAGDETKLLSVLQDWQVLVSAESDKIGAKVIAVIRKIAQAKKQILSINSSLERLQTSDLNLLMVKYEKAKSQGHDLISEMASNVQRQHDERKQYLNSLQLRHEI